MIKRRDKTKKKGREHVLSHLRNEKLLRVRARGGGGGEGMENGARRAVDDVEWTGVIEIYLPVRATDFWVD